MAVREVATLTTDAGLKGWSALCSASTLPSIVSTMNPWLSALTPYPARLSKKAETNGLTSTAGTAEFGPPPAGCPGSEETPDVTAGPPAGEIDEGELTDPAPSRPALPAASSPEIIVGAPPELPRRSEPREFSAAHDSVMKVWMPAVWPPPPPL